MKSITTILLVGVICSCEQTNHANFSKHSPCPSLKSQMIFMDVEDVRDTLIFFPEKNQWAELKMVPVYNCSEFDIIISRNSFGFLQFGTYSYKYADGSEPTVGYKDATSAYFDTIQAHESKRFPLAFRENVSEAELTFLVRTTQNPDSIISYTATFHFRK